MTLINPARLQRQPLASALNASLFRARRRAISPLGAVGRGALAGVVGTVAMTAYERAVLKAGGSEPSGVAGDVAKRLAEGLFQRELSQLQRELAGGGLHILYGASWGAFYGATQSTFHHPALVHGLALGTFLWGLSLVSTPALNLAPSLPLSEHLVYGLGVAGTYALLER
jgi:hypothetical protein